MKFIFFMLPLLLMSCGPKNHFPVNKASPAESAELNAAILKIQADFDREGINIDLRRARYVVNDLPNARGMCYGVPHRLVGIAIDHDTIADQGVEGYILPLHATLLHEIGHCFFDRDHEFDTFAPGEQRYYEVRDIGRTDGHPSSALELWPTIMAGRSRGDIPAALWRYYVRETAGLERAHSVQEFRSFARIEERDIQIGD